MDIYDRTYTKLSGFLAELVALLKTYLVAIIFIVNPLQKFQFYRKFIGDCCTIDRQNFDVLMPYLAQQKKSKIEIDKTKLSLTTKKDIFHSEPITPKQTRRQIKTEPVLETQSEKIETESNDITSNAIVIQDQNQKSTKENLLFTNNDEEETKPNDSTKSNNQKSNDPIPESSNDVSNTQIEPDQIFVDIPKPLNPAQSYLTQSLGPQKIFDSIKVDQFMMDSEKRNINLQDRTLQPNRNDLSMIWKGKGNSSDKSSTQMKQDENMNMKNYSFDFPRSSFVNKDQNEKISQSFCDQNGIQNITRRRNYSQAIVNKERLDQQMFSLSSFPTRVKNILTRLKENFQPQNLKEVDMTITEYILSLFVKNPKRELVQKKILYQAGHDCVVDILDVRNLLIQRNEMELLKLLILDKENLALFDSVARQKMNIIDKFEKKEKFA